MSTHNAGRPVDTHPSRAQGHCQPSPPHEVDVEVLRAKYEAERLKRIRPEGQDQYLVAEGEFADAHQSDPYTPFEPRDPISDEIEVVILGGGWAGLVTAKEVQEAGVDDFRIIEHAGDFGGVWYWNRYPGIQVDTDSYCYLPLLEETGYVPKEKYSTGQECFEHAQRIGKHYGLYEKTIFSTLVQSLEWDESIQRWRIGTNRNDDIRARHVVMCQGPFNKPKLPGIPGIKEFKGHTFHSARWDYEYTGGSMDGGLHKLAGKKVAIIGTGASGIGCIPHLAESSDHLYVFQRTPSYIHERSSEPTDPEWVKNLEPGWQAERRRNFHNAAFAFYSPGEPDLICDAWTEPARNVAAQLNAANAWGEVSIEEIFARKEVEDFRVMDLTRKRVDTVVKDKETAEKLKPYYRFLCKRPGFSDNYLPTFNRDNVTLVDVSATKGVERITEKGLVSDGVEYEVDCIIFASGFEITTTLDRKLGIHPFTGRDGRSLYEHWRDDYRTVHGITSHGFPNLFHTGFVQGGVTAATPDMFEQQARHIGYILGETQKRDVTVVEPTAEAEQEWFDTVRAHEVDTSNFELTCTPGYYNNEGEKTRRSHLGDPFWGGFYAMEDLLREWRESGDLPGFELRS